jgi:hypothetical protein
MAMKTEFQTAFEQANKELLRLELRYNELEMQKRMGYLTGFI